MKYGCTQRHTVVDLNSRLFNYQLKGALWEVQSVQKRRSNMPSVYFKRQGRVSFDIPFRAQGLMVKCHHSFSVKQNGQCDYNVTLRHVRVTTVAGEEHNYYIFCVCVCRIRYPACNALARYCHLWPAQLYGGADKSLARPERKQANVSVRMA